MGETNEIRFYTRYVGLIGIVAFALLLIAQIKLFEERMIVDSAVSTFIICNTQSFDVTENRWAVAINQVLPVIATHFTSDVRWIVASFYVNDYLWYLGFFLLFLFGFRQPATALALLVGYFTTLGYNYFILTYSVPLTWPLLLTVVLALNGQILQQKPVNKLFTLLVCFFFLAFSNPVNTITTGLFLVYLLSQHWPEKTKRNEVLLASAVFGLLVVIKNINPDPYDVQRISGFNLLDLSKINLGYLAWWAKDFVIAYPIGTCLLIMGVALAAHHLYHKHTRLQGIALLACYAYLAAVFVLYGLLNTMADSDLTAKALTPLTMLFSYIFITKLFSYNWTLKHRAYSTAFAVCIILISAKYYFLVNEYVATSKVKLAICKALIEQTPDSGSKYYVYTEQLPEHDRMPIINSMEVVVVSALANKKPFDKHIVVADSMTIQNEVLTMANDEVFHMEGSRFVLDVGNEYFEINEEEPWQELTPAIDTNLINTIYEEY